MPLRLAVYVVSKSKNDLRKLSRAVEDDADDFAHVAVHSAASNNVNRSRTLQAQESWRQPCDEPERDAREKTENGGDDDRNVVEDTLESGLACKYCHTTLCRVARYAAGGRLEVGDSNVDSVASTLDCAADVQADHYLLRCGLSVLEATLRSDGAPGGISYSSIEYQKYLDECSVRGVAADVIARVLEDGGRDNDHDGATYRHSWERAGYFTARRSTRVPC